MKFAVWGRIRSIRFAIRGIGLMLRTQPNAWVHAVATLLVVAAGFYFGVGGSEWSWLVLAIVVVWTTEALNTALELLADMVSPGFHPMIEKSKDVAAGGVLIAAMGSVVVGIIVLGPHVLQLLKVAS